jgi:rhodanese-related sulfurtransferase
LVGAVARTDLVDPDRTEELARQAYRSVHERILELPDEVPVYPTHGAGSFCSAPAGAERVTTIGRERASNPLLAAHSEDAFVAQLLDSLGSYPTYFRRLAEVNRRGPGVLRPWPSLAALDIHEARARLDQGAIAVDVRPIADYAAGHIPGALSIALRPAFATWLGWLVGPEQDIVFIAGQGQDRDDLVSQSLKVGYETLVGELSGGMNAWRAAGYPEQRIDLVMPARLPKSTPLVDVRQAAEFAAGHIPGAVHAELGSLLDVRGLPDGPLTVMCEHGSRGMTGASVLERAGRRGLAVLVGGPADWSALPGHRLVTAA